MKGLKEKPFWSLMLFSWKKIDKVKKKNLDLDLNLDLVNKCDYQVSKIKFVNK